MYSTLGCPYSRCRVVGVLGFTGWKQCKIGEIWTHVDKQLNENNPLRVVGPRHFEWDKGMSGGPLLDEDGHSVYAVPSGNEVGIVIRASLAGLVQIIFVV
jgi:hypothetical protein